MQDVANIIQEYLGVSISLQKQVIYSFLTILILWIINRTLRKLVFDHIDDMATRYQWQKIIYYIEVILALIFFIRIWFGAFEQIGTYLGLLSAGLAIAFKDLLVNFAGWIFIIIRKPLKAGDRIQIGEITGDVIDIRIFQFSVIEIGNWVDADQSTGRIIHIPNGIVFQKPQANYTAGFEYIWNEIPVLVTFESDWKTAKAILLKAVNNHAIHLSAEAEKQIIEASKKFLIYYRKLTPIVYTSVRDSGVLLTMRYLCNARQRRSTEQAIWEEVLAEFQKYKNIDFAYPTQRFYDNPSEGKEGKK